jgi:hypothetical protein
MAEVAQGQWSESAELNPITNSNPVYSHSYTWQYIQCPNGKKIQTHTHTHTYIYI